MFGHYTSQRGLLGIISNEILWATNIKFLNDEHEFQHALDLIREIIPTSKITPEMKEYEAYETYKDGLLSKLTTLDKYTTESIFTLSFSSEIDLLSQWRGYCPDNNGYCLVFDVDALYQQALVKYGSDNVHLLDCVYEKKEKEKKLREHLSAYWLKYQKAVDKEQKESVLDEFAKKVMLLASHYKHPSFSEEKEKRIVVIKDYFDTNRLQFREGRISLVPYIEIDAPLKCLKMICIGPCSNEQLARRSLELFLEKMYGYPFGLNSDLAIKFSEAPYRSW